MNPADLPTAATLPRPDARTAHWRPGLPGALHSEIFASSKDGSGAGAALALARDALRVVGRDREEPRGVLWVQDAASIRLTGRPYRPGLPEDLRRALIHVAAGKAEDALFALEEGLRCRDLACVIGEIAGNPKAFDFTASRRLSLTAEKHGVPLFLVRHDAARDLSSARMRWQVRSAASPVPRWNQAAPGMPSWHAELFRARNHVPGEWILRDERERLTAERPLHPAAPDHGDLAGAAGAGSLAAS